MKVRLTKEDAIEVQHKIGVLMDSPELQSEYSLTRAQVDELFGSIPFCGEWEVPEFAAKAVREEMSDHVRILRDGCAEGARSDGKMGQFLSINKQAKRLERIFKA